MCRHVRDNIYYYAVTLLSKLRNAEPFVLTFLAVEKSSLTPCTPLYRLPTLSFAAWRLDACAHCRALSLFLYLSHCRAHTHTQTYALAYSTTKRFCLNKNPLFPHPFLTREQTTILALYCVTKKNKIISRTMR